MLAAKKIGRRGPASINFTGFVTLLRFLKAGSATLSFWEAPPIADEFQASQAGHCRLVDRRVMADGEEILVDGRHQSFVIEHASDDILFFQAVARAGCAPVGVEYDSDSLAFLGASSTDEASSRLQMMVSLLRAHGARRRLPDLRGSARQPALLHPLARHARDAGDGRRRRAAGAAPDGRRRSPSRHSRRRPADARPVLRGQPEAGEGETLCRA